MKNLKQCSIICLAIMLIATSYGCDNLTQEKYVGTALDPLTSRAQVDTNKYNAEYFLYGTVKINGVLPLHAKYADFLKVIGQPDSVINFKAGTECQFFEEPYKYIYFQGCMFYLVKGTAIFQNIDFKERPDLELKTPAITLNAKTSLKDIQKLFPKAVRKIRTVNRVEGVPVRLVDIGASKELADEWWILSFDGDKLVGVEIYGPC